MAASNQMLHKIETELVDIQEALNKTTNAVQQIVAAIEDSKGKQNTIASAAEFDGEVQQVLPELQQIEVERKQILEQFHDILENSNDVRIVQILKHNLHQFGCQLRASSDANNRILYKFDFGSKRCIIVTMNALRLELVRIYPEQRNFAKLKELLDESQDLMGLLNTFGDMYKNV
ncbi:uncharacterized protein LOC116805633 [Drosophila grimshawi]|uniref:uncharacterized protein LOC116805633 n=1 Tax=Drosophila grimshawi TaxID=7222 RepID=UPI000C8715B2|nr:uncharacterized protein LOC116805633 [Drosophila grimshawi]